MKRAAARAAAPALQYRYAHATDRGRVREQNEDAIGIAEECGLALVADGMGGYNAGEVASGMAANFLVMHLVDDLRQLRDDAANRRRRSTPRALHALLRARIDGANDAIIDAAFRQPAFQGMGTTLAMLLFDGSAAITLHLGDSRVYRMRRGVLSLLTRDHSLLQEQIDAGMLTPDEARESINRNFVTRALGVDPIAEPEINEYDLVAGDLYLLCSDGLPDMLSDEEIFDFLYDDAHDRDGDGDADDAGAGPAADAGRENGSGAVRGRVLDDERLVATATRLVDAANANGGRDNVSVVLASVGWPREIVGDGAVVSERGARDEAGLTRA